MLELIAATGYYYGWICFHSASVFSSLLLFLPEFICRSRLHLRVLSHCLAPSLLLEQVYYSLTQHKLFSCFLSKSGSLTAPHALKGNQYILSLSSINNLLLLLLLVFHQVFGKALVYSPSSLPVSTFAPSGLAFNGQRHTIEIFSLALSAVNPRSPSREAVLCHYQEDHYSSMNNASLSTVCGFLSCIQQRLWSSLWQHSPASCELNHSHTKRYYKALH